MYNLSTPRKVFCTYFYKQIDYCILFIHNPFINQKTVIQTILNFKRASFLHNIFLFKSSDSVLFPQYKQYVFMILICSLFSNFVSHIAIYFTQKSHRKLSYTRQREHKRFPLLSLHLHSIRLFDVKIYLLFSLCLIIMLLVLFFVFFSVVLRFVKPSYTLRTLTTKIGWCLPNSFTAHGFYIHYDRSYSLDNVCV